MRTETEYFKHSNSGDVVEYFRIFIEFPYHIKKDRDTPFVEFYFLNGVKKEGKPDLTGFVPLSEKKYKRITKRQYEKATKEKT